MSPQKQSITVRIDKETDSWIDEALEQKLVKDTDGAVVESRGMIIKTAVARLLGKSLKNRDELEKIATVQKFIADTKMEYGFTTEQQVVAYHSFLALTKWKIEERPLIYGYIIEHGLTGQALEDYLNGLVHGTVKLAVPVVVPEGF